jgi:hypothetical protein
VCRNRDRRANRPYQEPRRAWKEARRKLVEAQGGLCAVCGERKPLELDHDHKTGVRRGALCHPCNLMLGGARDDPRVLAKGIEYLARTRLLTVETPARVEPKLCSCGIAIARKSTTCRACARLTKFQPTKIPWPTMAELRARVDALSVPVVARELGVSLSAVYKHLQGRYAHGANAAKPGICF